MIFRRSGALTRYVRDGTIIAESDTVTDFTPLGKINIKLLEEEFGRIATDEIIITSERIEHIKLRHYE